MAQAPLVYWTPGGEERQLRIFISHRFDKDEALYDEVCNALERNSFSVQDLSLKSERPLAGPRGGDLPRLQLQAEIAARIYTADVLIAPSRPAVSRSQWVTWEVQLAAIGYGIPILFVNERKLQKRTRLVAQVGELELPYAVCDPEPNEVVRNITTLLCGRPHWGVRQEEPDQTIRFRGPPVRARNEVLRVYPFQPRLPPVQTQPSRRGFWSFLSGGEPRA